MKNTFCISIDTEPDCDINWKRSKPLTFESVNTGIPKILRPIWNCYGIKPVYFVSPEVVKNDQCCETIKKEIELGAEIGAHLHPEYIEPHLKYDDASGTNSNEFPCLAYDDSTEFEKLKNLTELIKNKLQVTPVSYRAARYGADIGTIHILIKLEYQVDSSVTPHINWAKKGGVDHSRAPEQPYFIDYENYYKEGKSQLLEVPITISGKRAPFLPEKWLFYKWLRPSHMTALEMKLLIKEFIKKYDTPVLNMMFHSMEIIPKKSPFVRTAFGQKLFLKRIEKTIKYLLKKDFVSMTLKEVYYEKL